MTTDEIMRRHNLTWDDFGGMISNQYWDYDDGVSIPMVVEWPKENKDYALMSTTVSLAEFETAFQGDVQIIGYYLSGGEVYLVKRKTPNAIELTASVEYRFGLDARGNMITEYGKFKIQEERTHAE